MSLVSTLGTTPARIMGVYRLLAKGLPGAPTHDELCRAFMPPSTTDESTKSPRNLIEGTLQEGMRLGLWSWSDGGPCSLHAPPVQVGDLGQSNDELWTLLADAVWGKDGLNTDLGYAIAWLLMQDPRDGGWGVEDVSNELKDTEWSDKTGITERGKFTNFRDWAVYLGFAWQLSGDSVGGLLPDPTVHIRRRLPDIFKTRGTELTSTVFLGKLSLLSPVFEGGAFRKDVEASLERRPESQFAATTAMALQRLQEDGRITLSEKADAPEHIVLRENGETAYVSHITWTG